MIRVFVTGPRELVQRLDSMPASVSASLLRKVYELSLKLENYIKTTKLAGGVLQQKTGRLMRSVGSKVEETSRAVFGIVFQSADVPYGAIHEFGGQTQPHLILPKKASVLAFNWKGENVFFRSVNHPGSIFPERSYMRSGLSDMSREISMGLKEAVLDGIMKAK